ncbi:hypothetical protein BDR07DRAFT_1310779, partial [Suillus spraguei]
VPLLGPQFLPPMYLHSHKRPGGGPVKPTAQYLKPLNIVHPFYFPQLAQCPHCGSQDSVVWEDWTSTGAQELHGLCYEEMALGTQLQCNICKEKLAKKPPTTRNSQGLRKLLEIKGYCFATISATYWKSWEHWKIPCEHRMSNISHVNMHLTCVNKQVVSQSSSIVVP